MLCPVKAGDIGSKMLDIVLRDKVNPKSPMKEEQIFGEHVFRVGDRVMQIKNNYEREWYTTKEFGEGMCNGDIGNIIRISAGNVYVDFDGKITSYETNELAELQTELEAKKTTLEESKAEFDVQMDNLSERQTELEDSKKAQQQKQSDAAEKYREVENIISELDKDSEEYKKQIKRKEAEREALEAEIDAIIKAEGSQVGDIPDEEYENDGELGWPLKERCTITAGYPYYPSGGRHWGIDICLCTKSGSTRDSNGNSLSYGEPYYAAQGGEVIIADWHSSFGNYVVVDHGDGKQTLYAHSKSLNVKKGDIVKKGQQLGLMGDTGNVTGPHLHFEVRIKKADGSVNRVNPLDYVSKPSYVI